MSDEIKKGLLGIVVDETEVSKVMPEINSLTYRGYAAQDLCEYCRFEEVAYLILNKDLPNTIELRKFEKEERNNRDLSKDLYSILIKMPKKSENNKLKPYETKSITWNKGKQGKYKILSKINRKAFEKAQAINKKET